MKPRRAFTCPKCGSKVRIPLFWIMGIEGIFRCGSCKLSFKTGYKMGAVLFALALTCSIVTAQILVWIFSAYSLLFFVLLIIPLWLFYGYYFRKGYMLYRVKRKLKAKTE